MKPKNQANPALENTTTSTASKPPNGQCQGCGEITQPKLIRGGVNMSSWWYPAVTQCTPCLIKQRECEQEKRAKLELEAACQKARISKRARERSFASFCVSAENQKAHLAALSFQINPEGKGLMFYGKCGVGKTHLASAIANRFVSKLSLLYVSCPELLYEIRSTIQHDRDSQVLEQAMRVKLLILDDIGAEKPSDWVRETLFLIVNRRYEERIPTIYTTNLDLDALEQNLSGRIASRIAETCELLNLEGHDHRIQKKLGT